MVQHLKGRLRNGVFALFGVYRAGVANTGVKGDFLRKISFGTFDVPISYKSIPTFKLFISFSGNSIVCANKLAISIFSSVKPFV